ncbi:MAG: 16S rRNA (uracil(1498)-N(3))-methyltransferase [Hyphomonadaceae bacterium]|nr:16S rRNA (uracil(1498)-N(3))-methyltransferase [Hyphomonadaceae bacterium]MBC6411826.1 16S rRNA (uracil(1498)-N(3))-methyltransferase [Hyphomonadaceae bacterium]
MRENRTLVRLYVNAPLSETVEKVLPRNQAHYLGNVLRKTVGDQLRVFNGQDGEWSAEIVTITRKSCQLSICKQLRKPYAAPDIWLLFAPVRKPRTAFIFEKSTELGVSRLQPVITERTQFPKFHPDKMGVQIIGAAEQTERLDLPEVNDTISLAQLLYNWDGSRQIIFADEGGDCAPALDVLQNLGKPAALLIGPEGGFTDREREFLRAKDYVTAVSLGPRVLRADTAAASLLALWQAVRGDWGG